jgi:hypothetical protein
VNSAEESQRQTAGNTRVGLHGLQRRDGTGHRLVAEERDSNDLLALGAPTKGAGCEASKCSVDIVDSSEALTTGTTLNKAMTADFDRTVADQAAEHGRTRSTKCTTIPMSSPSTSCPSSRARRPTNPVFSSHEDYNHDRRRPDNRDHACLPGRRAERVGLNRVAKATGQHAAP